MTILREGIYLKIGIFAPEIRPEAGGSYRFVTQLLAEISAIESTNSHEFVILTSSSLPVGKMISHKLPKLSNGLVDKFRLVLIRILALLNGKTIPSNSALITARVNRQLRGLEIDIVWALAPNSIVFEVPFISTIWDLEHWNKPYFPEFHAHSESWQNTENAYRIANSRAALIIVGTQTSAEQVNEIYGIPRERIFVNPFPLVQKSTKSERNPYMILYPAQFWPHKNHLVLLKALAQVPHDLRNKVKLVLTGGDQGNLDHVIEKITELKLTQNVEIKGFVYEEELQLLYRTARITVFPSYFGPDNLPPLESLSYGTLTAVADIPGAREYLADSVVYFPPNDFMNLAAILVQAITDVNWGDEKNEIIPILFYERNWTNYVAKMITLIDELSLVRENWA